MSKIQKHTQKKEDTMSEDKPLSQQESRFVSDWLRDEKKVPIGNAFIFWRKTPELAADFVNHKWSIRVTADEIKQAAGRIIL